jgi:hypothetical protein
VHSRNDWGSRLQLGKNGGRAAGTPKAVVLAVQGHSWLVCCVLVGKYKWGGRPGRAGDQRVTRVAVWWNESTLGHFLLQFLCAGVQAQPASSSWQLHCNIALHSEPHCCTESCVRLIGPKVSQQEPHNLVQLVSVRKCVCKQVKQMNNPHTPKQLVTLLFTIWWLTAPQSSTTNHHVVGGVLTTEQTLEGDHCCPNLSHLTGTIQ